MAHEVGHFYDTEIEVSSKTISNLLAQISVESNFENEKDFGASETAGIKCLGIRKEVCSELPG